MEEGTRLKELQKEDEHFHTNDKRSGLLYEKSTFMTIKKTFIFLIVMYSCLIYPIEFQEVSLYDIAATTDIEVESFELERNIRINQYLWFFTIDLKYNHLSFQLFLVEIIFLFDMVISFFERREEDVKKYDKLIDDISITSKSYINDGFWFDFLIWFPWGPIMARMIHEDFQVFNFVKCLRLVAIQKYMNDKTLKQLCERLYDYRFQSILDDPIKSIDFRNNRTMIESRILTNNFVITFKIFFYTILALYFTGLYWLCFSLIFFSWNNY